MYALFLLFVIHLKFLFNVISDQTFFRLSLYLMIYLAIILYISLSNAQTDISISFFDLIHWYLIFVCFSASISTWQGFQIGMTTSNEPGNGRIMRIRNVPSPLSLYYCFYFYFIYIISYPISIGIISLWYDMIWCDMIWYDMIWYDYDMM